MSKYLFLNTVTYKTSLNTFSREIINQNLRCGCECVCVKGLQIGNYFGRFDYIDYFAIILPIIFSDIVD